MAEGLRAESASPLYAQVMERIQQDLVRGVYPVGSRIPAEHELEIRYSVSRVTVRRALQELTNAGLLERKQGKGTFVSVPRKEEPERHFQGFHEACKGRGVIPSVGALWVREIKAGPEDGALNLPKDAGILEIRRVLEADGVPVILETCHFSMAYAWLEQAELKGSLYGLLQEYGVWAEKSTYNIALCKAGAEEASLLRTAPGAILLQVQQVVYDRKGRPLHTGHQLIRGEQYTLYI